MSAPVTDRPRAATRTRARATTPVVPAQRRAEQIEGVAGRAYARRDERTRRSNGAPRAAAAAAPRRAQFVLLVMGLLTTGLVLTLWLSTAAAADSYRLQDARDQARELGEQAAVLHREVAVLASPTELARRATAQGMVAVDDPARLVAAPDGTVTLVGEPSAVRAPAPPPATMPPAVPAPQDGPTAQDGPGATPDAGTGAGPTADVALAAGNAATGDAAGGDAGDGADSEPTGPEGPDPDASDPAGTGLAAGDG